MISPGTPTQNDAQETSELYGNFSGGISKGAFQTPGYPVRSAETVIEATYQYQVAPWWMLQGELQYIFHPGGGIPDPNNRGARIGNEAVAGLRTVITF